MVYFEEIEIGISGSECSSKSLYTYGVYPHYN